MRLASVSLALAAVLVVITLSRCGKMCIAGMGDCSVYKDWTTDPVNPAKPKFQLVAVPATVPVNGSATLKLTTTALGVTSGSCAWDITLGGGSLQQDSAPTVFGALCTATYGASSVPGKATIRVSEKNSGNIVQMELSVTSP